MTISDYLNNEVIVPSKGNGLSLWEVDFMFPHKENIPLHPPGISWVKEREVFRASKWVNGVRKHIIDSPNLTEAVLALEKFCIENNIEI